ncbi:MAG TPA: acyltransferase, partial [Solirubrobacterales bacterium]|nr:acyltransferase [Solirubrobacterales bacterium]
MFGAFRLLLALMVVTTHLGGRGAVFHYGPYGVFGFYVVSGFLMTAILRRTYGFDLRGSTSFWLNRFLRIFPVYHLVALATLVLVGLFPRDAVLFQPAWLISNRAFDWLGNLLLVPYALYDQRFRLVPPSWSLGVELVYYFVIWLVMARSRRLALACAALGVAWVAWVFSAGLGWDARYFPLQAAMLPFAVGSLISHHGTWIRRRFGERTLGLAAGGVALLVVHTILAVVPCEGYALGAGFYVNFALVSLVSALLAVGEPASRR